MMTIDTQVQSQLTDAVRKSKRNLINFRKILLENNDQYEVDAAEFHYDWSKALLFGTDHEAIEGFRESAKGQYVLRGFPLYRLMFPVYRQSYIVIVKNNATQARAKLKEIEDEYCANPMLRNNLVKINSKSGDLFDVLVNDAHGNTINVRIEAYGKGASIRGLSNRDRRPDIIIADDIQDLEDAESNVTLEKDWQWFLSDVYFLGQYSRIFLIGNNLGEKCIIERVAANADQLNFNFRRIPCMYESEDRPPVSSWPAKNRIEDILKEKDNFRELGKLDIWLREKMCLATSEETRLFPRGDFRYYTYGIVNELRRTCNAYMTIDPAYSEVDTSCFRAIVVNLVDADNKWFIAEISAGLYDSAKLVDEIFRLIVAWRLHDAWIEEGFAKVLEPFIQKEMSRRNVFFNIGYLKHGGRQKMNRIRLLQPRFKSHTIYFPSEAPWLSELETELESCTIHGSKGMRIDVVDALAYMDQIAEPPYNAVNTLPGFLPREADSNTVTPMAAPQNNLIRSLPREAVN